MITKPVAIVSDDLGVRPGIRPKIETTRLVDCVLTFNDVNTINGNHPLEQVALGVFGDSKYWFILADVNPLRDPASWQVGEKIKIPTDSAMTLIRSVTL